MPIGTRSSIMTNRAAKPTMATASVLIAYSTALI
jgi:hypothetical protein